MTGLLRFASVLCLSLGLVVLVFAMSSTAALAQETAFSCAATCSCPGGGQCSTAGNNSCVTNACVCSPPPRCW